MSGDKKSVFLEQLEQLAEVTSDSPRKVLKRPHVLYDSEADDLRTPPRNRLLPSFPTCDNPSKSNDVESSPDQSFRTDVMQPCETVSPSSVRECSFVVDGILANLSKRKEFEESLEHPLKAVLEQPYEESSPRSANKCSLSPLATNDSDDSDNCGDKEEKKKLILNLDAVNSNDVALRNDASSASSSDSGFYTQ